MKKVIISLLFIVLSTTVVLSATLKKVNKPSDYALGISYEQAQKSSLPSIVLFYADWCTYCRGFMPTYKNLGETYNGRYNLVMLNIDKNENLGREYTVSSLPTLYIIDPKYNNRIHLDNGIYGSKLLLQKELDRYLNIRARIK